MTLRIRAIDLSATTEEREFGARIEFNLGLNVISADNTKGKSTLVQAIIYGLGLEKMLSPRREVPLPRVMTKELQEEVSGPEIPVLASRVQLEIENGTGEVITLHRVAKGEGDTRLVTVFRGPMLSSPDKRYERSDYYALDPGAAQTSTGLHHFLASYLGWDLPQIPRWSGGDSPLYLEALFPLFFVEQKVGWSAIPANFPTYLGLKDMPRRSVEYVMGLKVNEIEVDRQHIEAKIVACRERWASLVEEAYRLAELVSGRVEGIPTDPNLNWEPELSSHLSIPEGKGWVEINEIASKIRLDLKVEKERSIPTAKDDGDSVEQELSMILEELAEFRAVRHDLMGSLGTERAQLRATRRQLNSIEEDLQRHKDATKILSIGGDIGVALGSERCPTCHQDVNDSLLPPDAIDQPMSLEENRDFLLKQRDLFRNLESRGKVIIDKQENEFTLLVERINQSYARSRALQDTQSSASSTPSTAAIQRRVELQARLESLKKVDFAFGKLLSELTVLREDFRGIKADEAKLPSKGLPSGDKARLEALTASITNQLVEYGFSTFRPSDIQVSEETYRPIREGFEIGFELSASDAIRLKWAYQLALLEVTQTLTGAHHPGLLIFDEPRQQETARLSFHRLIARASKVALGLQVIFTTSEHKETLHEAIEGLDLNLIDLPGFLLQPR